MVIREIGKFFGFETGKGSGKRDNEKNIEISEEKKREIEGKLIEVAKRIPNAENFRSASYSKWKDDIKICFEFEIQKGQTVTCFLSYYSRTNSLKAWPKFFPIEELKKILQRNDYSVENGSEFYVFSSIFEESLSPWSNNAEGGLSLVDSQSGKLSYPNDKSGATSLVSERNGDEEK
ncbi:MAG: hypothetical protein KBD73_04005 [Candidatus Magasanikbacteria bacterium]|nr:hypothetical protein [Candidatus Magasanikbacteria bacterium]